MTFDVWRFGPALERVVAFQSGSRCDPRRPRAKPKGKKAVGSAPQELPMLAAFRRVFLGTD